MTGDDKEMFTSFRMYVNTFLTEPMLLSYFPCNTLFDHSFLFGCLVS